MESWKAMEASGSLKASIAKKEAAEKLHGGVLFKQGPASRIRALVVSSAGTESPTLFYERY